MIKLHKGREPQALRDNARKWTEELLNLIEAGDPSSENIANRYRRPEVKDALKKECHLKCMYCESFIEHVTFSHIEHIKPKAKNRYPEFTFEWTNMGLCCPKCNTNKGDKYSDSLPFINPYEDEPNKHFVAFGPVIFHMSNDARAELTERTLDLNRKDLMDRRMERIECIRDLADRCARESNDSMRDVLNEALKKELAPDTAYCMFTRSVIERVHEKIES